MAEGQAGTGVKIIEHPNRDKAESKATKAAVVFLLLATVGIVLIITVAGWSKLEGAKYLQLPYMALYLFMAYYIARWTRGILPIAAAFAVILLIFAIVAGPPWFDRDNPGYDAAGLPASVLGVLTLVIIPVQALLIFAAMRGFGQGWNIEVERWASREERERLAPEQ
jgi:hypothetical protein